jgi:hypothetical protein
MRIVGAGALVSALCLAGAAGRAGAGVPLGVRAGYTINPDQIHFGGHLDLDLLGRIRLRPNLEIGLGDNLVLAALNLEGNYRFGTEREAWNPYVGGGLGINFVDPDNDALAGDSRTESGVLILAGLERGFASGGAFFIESKVGLANAPDLKFTVGWTFGRGDSES